MKRSWIFMSVGLLILQFGGKRRIQHHSMYFRQARQEWNE